MKTLYLILISSFLVGIASPKLHAQAGPGGITPAAWYKADAQNTVFSDAGTTNATDNDNVYQWNEYQGFGHNLTQTSSARQPMFSNASTLVNFNPTVTFNGPNDDYLEYEPATGVNIIDRTQGTLYVAGYFNTVSSAGIMGFDASMDYPGLHTSNNGQNNLLFYTGGPGYQGLSTNSFTDNNYFISGANWTNGAGSTSPYASSIVSLDGVRSSYNTNQLQNAVINTLSRDIRVGRDSNWGGMNGQVNEVIIFENALSMAEMDRVESYLSIKYGNTYAQGGSDYVNAAGATVWTADATYNQNIFGIARDDASELYQKQSKSTNQNQQLIIGAGTDGLANTNAANTNALNDGQFLMVGDNGLAQKLTTPLAYTDPGVGNGDTNFRFESVWKVQNTNGVGQVTIAWPAGIDNLYVVQSSDETFDATDDFEPMTGTVNINGVDYNTATVTLADGQYFTFAGFAHAPGGVYANLLMWHKADDGVTTPGQKDIWKDVSANGRDVFQPNNNANEPLLVTDAMYAADSKKYGFNFNPFYYFDGTNDFFYNENQVYFPTTDSPGSAYGVMMNADVGGWRTPYGWGDDDPNLVKGNNDYYITRNNGTAINEDVGANSLPAHIGGMSWRGATNGIYLNVNGQIYANETTNIGSIQSAVNFAIGSEGFGLTGNGYEVYQGGLPEVFAYSADHQNATGDEKQRINSYLAIKYGITLLDDAGTAVPNYLSSASVTVWNATTNAGYNNNIFGITNDYLSDLHQKQSQSINAGQQLIIGAGNAGLANTNAANTNALNDGQFLIVGDNGLSQSLSESLVYTGGSNGEVNLRFAAIWKAQNTNGVGTVTVAWPGNIRNLYVVKSSDETFDSSDDFYEMTTDATINGVDYKTTTISLADGEYFTFAGYGYAPAGVINNLSYWYRADKDAANTGDGTDVTSWTDFFSGTVSAQLGTSPLPDYVEGTANYFNFNPGLTFTANNEKIGNINVQTLSALEYDIFTFTKEGMSGTRYFNVGMNNTTFNGTNWDQPGFYANGSLARRSSTGGLVYGIANPGSIAFDGTIPSIMYHTFTDTSISKGLNGNANGTTATHAAIGQVTGGHIFGANNGNLTSGDDAGFVGDIGETIIYGAGNLTTEERRRVDSYLAIKYGITLDRVDTDHYLGSTASATSIIWDGADNTAFNNNIFGMARADIGGFEQKVSKSVNAGTILTIATDDDYTASNMDASRTSLANNETYSLIGDNEATGVTTVAGDRIANRVWRVQTTGSDVNPWVQADLSAYGFDSSVEMWVADDENFTTNLVKVPADAYDASDIATFNPTFVQGVRYFTFAVPVADYCVTGCNDNTFVNATDPNTIEYDNFVSTYHSTLIKEADGTFKVWGQDIAPNGTSDVYSPLELTPANGYNYTGTPLKATGGGQSAFGGEEQFALLTTDGLYVWGAPDYLISSGIKNTTAFGKITVGGKADGLPPGVAPEQVKMLFGSYQKLVITTCTGEAWVLSQLGFLYGDGATDNTANDMVWHRVKTAEAGNPDLENVVAVRGDAGTNLVALTADGELYTWGGGTYLGDSSNTANRPYATKMIVPAGVTPKMIGMARAAYYLLATDGRLFSLGSNTFGQLGDGTHTTRTTWIQLHKLTDQHGQGVGPLDNIAWISPVEHSSGAGSRGITVLTNDYKLWAWGQVYAGGLSPQFMGGNSTNADGMALTDEIIAVETGGHTTMNVKKDSHYFGYLGHYVNGSAGNGYTGGDYFYEYTYSTAEIDLCGAPVEEYCTKPGSTVAATEFTKTGISNLAGFANGWPGNVPNGFLAIESKNKGFVITRVANTSAIVTPVEGMLIYDLSANCVKLYNGTSWKCLEKDCTGN